MSENLSELDPPPRVSDSEMIEAAARPDRIVFECDEDRDLGRAVVWHVANEGWYTESLQASGLLGVAEERDALHAQVRELQSQCVLSGLEVLKLREALEETRPYVSSAGGESYPADGLTDDQRWAMEDEAAREHLAEERDALRAALEEIRSEYSHTRDPAFRIADRALNRGAR